MPIKISVKGGEYKWLFPTTKWNILDLNEEKATVKLDSNFYVGSFNVTGD
jgi:hypothetical protein